MSETQTQPAPRRRPEGAMSLARKNVRLALSLGALAVMVYIGFILLYG